MAVPIGAAISQSPPAPAISRTLSLRVDNDAFDFWMLPWNRPDEEYTSGVHITLDGGDAPRWARSWWRGRVPCAVGATSCRTGALEIGQDIYTPSVSVDSGKAGAGSRPSGGWLYASQSARLLDADRSTELTLSVGVTGEPSLARFTQRLAHSVAPEFNRPTDWSRSIAFEPGLIARVDHRRRWPIVDGEVSGDVIPRITAMAGNIRTSAEAGFLVRSGWHLSHPWLPSRNAMEVAIDMGPFARLVARDVFLDGNTFRGGPRVGHRTGIVGGEGGVTVRYGRFNAGYRVTTESRAWSGGPGWHPWSSLIGGVTIGR